MRKSYPEHNAEFVYRMEDVLEVYRRPYDPLFPVVCMDESTKQLLDEIRLPLPGRPGTPELYDCESRRNGVASLFLAFEPLAGWRQVEVTEQRTRRLGSFHPEPSRRALPRLQARHPRNLNTHSGASLYETFAPAEALRLLNRREIHYTPKHGSWLNMAEGEFSVLQQQCLDRRIGDSEILKQEIAAWQAQRNQEATGADWKFTTQDARVKLRKLSPSFPD